MHGVHEPVLVREVCIAVNLNCGGVLRIEEDGKGLYKLFYKSCACHAEERSLGDVRRCSVASCIPLFTWGRGVVIETKIGKLRVSDKVEISKLKEWVINSQKQETKN